MRGTVYAYDEGGLDNYYGKQRGRMSVNGMWRYRSGDLVWLHDYPGARIGLIREGLWSAKRGALYEIEPLQPAYAPGVTMVIAEAHVAKAVGADGSTYRPATVIAPEGQARETDRRQVNLPVLTDRRAGHGSRSTN